MSKIIFPNGYQYDEKELERLTGHPAICYSDTFYTMMEHLIYGMYYKFVIKKVCVDSLSQVITELMDKFLKVPQFGFQVSLEKDIMAVLEEKFGIIFVAGNTFFFVPYEENFEYCRQLHNSGMRYVGMGVCFLTGKPLKSDAGKDFLFHLRNQNWEDVISCGVAICNNPKVGKPRCVCTEFDRYICEITDTQIPQYILDAEEADRKMQEEWRKISEAEAEKKRKRLLEMSKKPEKISQVLLYVGEETGKIYGGFAVKEHLILKEDDNPNTKRKEKQYGHVTFGSDFWGFWHKPG